MKSTRNLGTKGKGALPPLGFANSPPRYFRSRKNKLLINFELNGLAVQAEEPMTAQGKAASSRM